MLLSTSPPELLCGCMLSSLLGGSPGWNCSVTGWLWGRAAPLTGLHGRHAHRLMNVRCLRSFLIVQSTGDFVARLLVLRSWEFGLRVSIILLWLTAVLEVMISPLTALTLPEMPRCCAFRETLRLQFVLCLSPESCWETFYISRQGKKNIQNSRKKPGFFEFVLNSHF